MCNLRANDLKTYKLFILPCFWRYQRNLADGRHCHSGSHLPLLAKFDGEN